MRIITFTLFTLLITNLIAQDRKPLILDRIIARVGSEHILYSEVQELYSYAKSQQSDYTQDIQCDILDQLVSKALLLDQARLDSIVIDDAMVEAEVQRRLEYILAQMGGSEERFEEYYGKTVLQQKEAMREPLRKDLIQQRIQQQLIADVDITPKEVKAYYESIPTDSLPYLNAEVELGEITMKTRISAKAKENAYEKIKNVRTRIVEGGEDFAELASIFSDDLGSARMGGDLGWAKRGSYVPEFEATAYALEEGEISEIIETQFGYHFLELLGRRGNSINIRHILVKPEETNADIEGTKVFLDSIAQAIRDDSISFQAAVRLYSDDKSQSYNNAGRLTNPETGDSFWETSQLPYQIYFAIESLEVGDISEVLEFEERGEKVFKIVQLQSKTAPHQASLESDYSRIAQIAKESKKNEYFNEWMDNKIQETKISIDPAFEDCESIQKYLNKNIRP